MNKIITNTLFMIIVIITFVVLGNLFFLSNISRQIEKSEGALIVKRSELNKIKESLDKMATDTQRINENIVLTQGQEGQLMGLFINKDMQNYLKVSSYDLYSTYYYKPETQDNFNSDISSSAPQSNSNTESNMSIQNGQLPELDANGMPIGSSNADEEDSWKGLNIQPIKLTYLTNI